MPPVSPAEGDARRRCAWARGALDVRYHDAEWGVPVHADRRLFELLILEGAQAGLSWSTILRMRGAYRVAFARFDPRVVARFTARATARLLANPGIVRNRAKIAAAVGNARASSPSSASTAASTRTSGPSWAGGRCRTSGARPGRFPRRPRRRAS